MRAGLQALLRANGVTTPQRTARVSREPTKNKAQASQPIRMPSRKPPANRKPGKKQPVLSSKSLLLPAKLKVCGKVFLIYSFGHFLSRLN